MAMGEPVPGAEVYIELEPDDQPIANGVTGSNGELTFVFPKGVKIPINGKFKFTITPKINTSKSNLENVLGLESHIITFPFRKIDGPTFRYNIIYIQDQEKAQGRGSFAVSGKSAAKDESLDINNKKISDTAL